MSGGTKTMPDPSVDKAAGLAWLKITELIYKSPYIPISELRPSIKQAEFLAYEGEECFLGGAMGGGKAVGINTYIATSMGWTTIGELKVGDYVYGIDRKPVMVLTKSGVMRDRDCYRLDFAIGNRFYPEWSIVADADHGWLTSSSLVTTKEIFQDLKFSSRGHFINGPFHRIEIVNCEKVESEPVQCIAVDALDGMFLVSHGMIPTHNSDGLLMAALMYITVPGYSALLLRKTYRQLFQDGGMIPRSVEWIGSKAKFNEKKMQWSFPQHGNSTLTFGYFDHDSDRNLYLGGNWQFCVGKGTPVRMADGKAKLVESLCVGDVVETLDGPRKVTRARLVRQKEAVVATAMVDGKVIGQQVQSADHSLLTGQGWISYDMVCASGPCTTSCATSRRSSSKSSARSSVIGQSCGQHPQREHLDRRPISGLIELSQDHSTGNISFLSAVSLQGRHGNGFSASNRFSFSPTLFRGDDKSSRLSSALFRWQQTPREGRLTDQGPLSQCTPSILDQVRKFSPACGACTSQPVRENDDQGFADRLTICGQRISDRPLSEGVRLQSDRTLSCSMNSERRCEVSCVRRETLPQGYSDHYSSCNGLCDGNVHLFEVDGLICPPSQDDAGQQIPIGFANDALGKTHRCTHPSWSYTHPYTKEK